jgi:transposase-like protein
LCRVAGVREDFTNMSTDKPDLTVPAAWYHVEQYANNPIEADHGQLKRRLRPMRGLQTDRGPTRTA